MQHAAINPPTPSRSPLASAFAGGGGRESWKTLETGCATELDFHFLEPTTAAFGLNNYVYILKKQ